MKKKPDDKTMLTLGVRMSPRLIRRIDRYARSVQDHLPVGQYYSRMQAIRDLLDEALDQQSVPDEP